MAGYRVYWGTAPRTYSSLANAGNNTTYTVTGLGPGTYYFAVTAYDLLGSESGFSNEVSGSVQLNSTCDINTDLAVNVLDLQRLANVILGATTCPAGCDINRDGRVDVLDLQVLANVILGVRVCP